VCLASDNGGQKLQQLSQCIMGEPAIEALRGHTDYLTVNVSAISSTAMQTTAVANQVNGECHRPTCGVWTGMLRARIQVSLPVPQSRPPCRVLVLGHLDEMRWLIPAAQDHQALPSAKESDLKR